MADLPVGSARPEDVPGDHKSVVLYAGVRTYCFRTGAELNLFLKTQPDAVVRIRE